MKLKLFSIPIAVVAGIAAVCIFHPGKAYAEPRFAGMSPSPLADKVTYSVDPMHMGLYFEITHLGLSKVQGRLNKVTGKIYEDSKDLTKSSVEISAETGSIDTGVQPRDEHLQQAEYFDSKKFPNLTFKSTKIVKKGKGYVAIGNLTIKGVTKQISLPFQHFGPYEMKGFGDQPVRVGVICDPITIKRTDFGVGTNQKLPDGTEGASDAVVIRISLEGTRDK